MKNFMPSIRQKITFGYYAITALIIGLSVFTFFELRYIENKIMFGEAITEFFDTTLEIRRFEKNFFLYEKRPDYDETIRYIALAQDIIGKNIKGFTAVATADQIAVLKTNLTKYADLMQQYAKTPRQSAARRTMLSGKIRFTGKDIITVADVIDAVLTGQQ
jgi:two-component system NtrC family sensor kinase